MTESLTVKTARKSGSLVVVGTGYQVCARITAEAAAEIENSDIVFYLVYDWMDEIWLRRIKANAVSLAPFFGRRWTAKQSCRMTVETIMRAVRKGDAVCIAFSGHPAVCVDPTRTALERARMEGFPAQMVPGISALDCLFADLCLDPTSVSCRVFDATRFVLRQNPIDCFSGLVLLQLLQIGASYPNKKEGRGLKLLQDLLTRFYGASYKVIHYQAALSPIGDSIIEEIPISALHRCEIKFKSTLYVPPRQN